MWERERVSEPTPNTLQYRTDGPEDAPVLVLGPALGTTWHMWDRQIPELTRHWRVLRFDLPGHGGAPAEPAPAVGELTDRLLATLDGLGVERFGYAGCSLGGAVGADLALRHPHRLASLALVATSARFGTPESWRQRGAGVRADGLDPVARATPEQWFTQNFAGAQPAIVDWAVQMVSTTDPGCYVAACDALAAFDAREGLARVGVPTLVLVGAEDQETPPADARVLVASIHDARLAVVPGASHLAPVEQPGAVTDLLVRHFTSAWRHTTPQTPPAPARATEPTPVATPTPAPAPAVSATPTPAPPPGPAASVVPGAPGVPGVPGGMFTQPTPPAGPSPYATSPAGPHTPTPVPAPDPAAPLAFPGFGPPPTVDPGPASAADAYDEGARVRREVLGDGPAESADAATGDFHDFVTRYAWGGVWARPGLDRRSRSLVTLTALTAGGHLDDLAAHTRAALRNGLTPEEIEETLLHTAVYCGVPAASAAFSVARRVISEESGPGAAGA
ncbi:bifunctional 3-oxoadipate enol-lactonase/4-carboxymuconolactone decarboxylase PcaDC [Streptomyces albireticuli]|uniref:bifunctional 3-oxoadipate enol-lactonase/4-carboxymuconolactone decarboxylase PcaDC n=1 Tax=Streptomyces albireticuli TaxID=1940 RepID=UPI00367F1F44